MPITPYLNGQHFDPDTKRIMGVAFEMTRVALRLDSQAADPLLAIIANKIIELAKGGERDANELCERTLADLATEPPQWPRS
jgi:hypothetical protein